MNSEGGSVLQDLLAMGFDEEAVFFALSQFPEGNLEDLVSCALMFTNEMQSAPIVASTEYETEQLKMVLIVRMDLEMSPGKVAAQSVHAALGCTGISSPEIVNRWQQRGETVICLKCADIDEMNGLKSAADQCGLKTYAVYDAGRTEVASGSQTVVAIGPDAVSKIDSITRHLKLY